MSDIPAFSVRSYPAFRMARLHRVYIDSEALYLIRMRGIIGHADAGSPFDLHPGRALTGMLIRWWARRSLDSAARALDSNDLHALLSASPGNLRVEPWEVEESRLDPPRMLGHGEHFARWSLTLRDRKRLSFQIEDEESFRTALEHLPPLLGATLRVSVS